MQKSFSIINKQKSKDEFHVYKTQKEINMTLNSVNHIQSIRLTDSSTTKKIKIQYSGKPFPSDMGNKQVACLSSQPWFSENQGCYMLIYHLIWNLKLLDNDSTIHSKPTWAKILTSSIRKRANCQCRDMTWCQKFLLGL